MESKMPDTDDLKEDVYKQALADLEKISDDDHSKIAEVLDIVGELCYQQYKHEEAVPYFKRAVEIYEAKLGLQRGKYQVVADLFNKVLETRDNVPGRFNHPVADAMHSLGMRFLNLSKHEEAWKYCKRAADILEAEFASDYLDIANVKNSLSLCCKMQGKYEEAEALLKRALEIHQKDLGDKESDVGVVLNNLGGLYLTQNKFEEAERCFKRALDVYQPGRRNPIMINMIKKNLDSYYRKLAEDKENVPLIDRLSEIGVKIPDGLNKLEGICKAIAEVPNLNLCRKRTVPHCDEKEGTREKIAKVNPSTSNNVVKNFGQLYQDEKSRDYGNAGPSFASNSINDCGASIAQEKLALPTTSMATTSGQAADPQQTVAELQAAIAKKTRELIEAQRNIDLKNQQLEEALQDVAKLKAAYAEKCQQ